MLQVSKSAFQLRHKWTHTQLCKDLSYLKENKYFRANNRTLKDKMTSISNALKVIVNLKCFENKDILESDTTIILASDDDL